MRQLYIVCIRWDGIFASVSSAVTPGSTFYSNRFHCTVLHCTESVHMFRSNVWVVGSPVFESILVCNNCEFSKLKIEFFF